MKIVIYTKRVERRMTMLKCLSERRHNYNANTFINELSDASKKLGILEAKIDAYQFNSILIPMLHVREATSSMYIEGTQMTVSDVFENKVAPKDNDNKKMTEVGNHIRAILYGIDHLRQGKFTHSFICKIHEIMMAGILELHHEMNRGKYKYSDNRIVNSAGTTVFVPPSAKETKKYMSELLDYMNDKTSDENPLIKAAVIHSQFESIHPFSDGNGRVGRVLFTLYLYASSVVNFPFFYISEAISMDKSVYYSMLNSSRENNYDEWLRFFLRKVAVQTEKHTAYIDSLNDLYTKTKRIVKDCINSPKFDAIIEYIFSNPILTAKNLAEEINVSQSQAIKYLNVLSVQKVLIGNDRKRGRTFFFHELLDLAR